MPEQPWFVHYPEGVPHELSLSPETLLAMFSTERAAVFTPAGPLFLWQNPVLPGMLPPR